MFGQLLLNLSAYIYENIIFKIMYLCHNTIVTCGVSSSLLYLLAVPVITPKSTHILLTVKQRYSCKNVGSKYFGPLTGFISFKYSTNIFDQNTLLQNIIVRKPFLSIYLQLSLKWFEKNLCILKPRILHSLTSPQCIGSPSGSLFDLYSYLLKVSDVSSFQCSGIYQL